jgi:hypothetical protein
MTTMLLNMQPGEPEAETSLLGWEAQKTALEEANRLLASSEFCQIFELPTQVSFSHDEWVEWMHPEDRICLPNGDVRWIRAMASPIMEQGKVARVYGTVHGITQRKESECELRKLSRTAEQSPATATVLVPLEP